MIFKNKLELNNEIRIGGPKFLKALNTKLNHLLISKLSDLID